MSKTPKHPEITVKVLNFQDDRVEIILTCLRALKQRGIMDELPTFADYISKAGPNGLIERIKDWFNVE